MNFDDIMSDITDKEVPENPSVLSSIFPIKGTNDLNEVIDLGTGFFVNASGYFITAGHVLQNKSLNYYAVINNNDYEFEIIFIEYFPIESQNGVLCKDLAICKLYLNIDVQNLLNIDDSATSINVSGFKSVPQGMIVINPIKQGDFYLHTYVIEKGIVGLEVKLKFGNDSRYKCTNTNSLKTIDGIKYGGLSGGPVYLGKTIYGMFISSEYILSSYIISKLDELGIKYNK